MTARRIAAPALSTVTGNYAPAVGTDLATLADSGPPQAGRLILWHGEPGTGKTNALRSLARAWEPWCATHVVTDPEAFLGHSAYALDVLTTDSTTDTGEDTPWKLVVLEDAGELLTADAHARTGQALARLLNVSDGLMGQGMNAIVLVTTNEPLGQMHPAISREGRCWMQTEFTRLPVDQANTWLKHNGCEEHVETPTTLANLYARLAGRAPKDAYTSGFGFTS